MRRELSNINLMIFVAATLMVVAGAEPEVSFVESQVSAGMQSKVSSAMAELADEQVDTVIVAKSSVQTLMAKGFKESDCARLAKVMCKNVENEVSTNQRTMDKLSDGKDCESRGLVAVQMAMKDHVNRVAKLNASRKKAKSISEEKIRIPVRQFGHLHKELGRHRCGWVFASNAYLHVQRRYNAAVLKVNIYDGEAKESRRTLKSVQASARHQRHKCLCEAKHTRDRFWKLLSKTSTRTRQEKAYAKCNMMRCVIAGTNVHDSRCKGTLHKLNNKKLSRNAESVVACAVHRKQAKTKKKVVISKIARMQAILAKSEAQNAQAQSLISNFASLPVETALVVSPALMSETAAEP